MTSFLYLRKHYSPFRGTLTPGIAPAFSLAEAYATHKYRYGYRKVAALFSGISEKTVQKVMQKKNYQPAKVTDNPLHRLVIDITYFLPFGQSMLNLSSNMDLYHCEIIAYTIGSTQDTAFVLYTPDQLKQVSEGIILHSDQVLLQSPAARN